MTAVDLEPATRQMADLVGGVPDQLLDAPTPCPGYSLGDLVDHVGGLTLAFTAAARKTFGDATSQGRRATRPVWATTGGPGSPGTWPPSPRRGASRRRGPE